MIILRQTLIFYLLLLTVFSYANIDSTSVVIVQDIRISGNQKTKDPIILRELTFGVGDSLTLAGLHVKLEASTVNLLKQPLFHFVYTEIEPGDSPVQVRILITVTERWYTWLWPVFEISDRNFNAWLENGDLTRLSYGLFFQQENFRGRLEKLHIRLKFGYQQQIAVLYESPYLNRKKTIGAGVSMSAGRQREVGYITLNDKLQYYRSSNFLLKELDMAVFVRYRPDIHFSHTLQLRFNRLILSDSLLKMNPDYTQGSLTTPDFAELSYFIKVDFRDQRAYPLRGWYGDAELARFGLLPGSEIGFITLRPNLRTYLPLAGRWFSAFGAAAKFTAGGEAPYYLNRALGYRRDYVRGYEYYVTEGQNFLVFKSDIKFALIQPAIKKIGWISSEKFNTIPYSVYLSAFADIGRAWPEEYNSTNNLQGKTQFGVGLGVDLITYYDKVMRMEFSVNAKGESGFYLHFMAAI